VWNQNERRNKDRLEVKLSDEVISLHFPHQFRTGFNMSERVTTHEAMINRVQYF